MSGKNSKISHAPTPIALFSGAWILVGALYSLHLSELLLFPAPDIWITIAFVISAFAAGILYSSILPKRSGNLSSNATNSPIEFERARRLTRRLLSVWVLGTIVEIIQSKGLPIIWLFTGSELTYFDFGIPSIHGFMNAILLSCCTANFYFWLQNKRKSHLYLALFGVVWGVIVISRNMMIVLLIQYLMLFLDKNRISARILLRYAAGALIMVLIFGVIGDLRSGAEAFLALAQPSENFPKWMPSGFLWVYMYLTTPLNNLQFDVNKEMISYDLSFPNTLSLLFPSVIRNVLFDNSSAEDTLVTQAFNVGTAFQGPYLDCGRFGIFVFGFVVGFVSGCYYRNRSSLYFKISYSVIAQCCLLSIFYNHFCYLPILFQFFILYLIFRRRKALWRCAFPHARTGTVVEQG